MKLTLLFLTVVLLVALLQVEESEAGWRLRRALRRVGRVIRRAIRRIKGGGFRWSSSSGFRPSVFWGRRKRDVGEKVEAPYTFAEFDLNGDKKIRLMEFSFILGRDDRELRKQFWIADTNEDDVLDEKEFYSAPWTNVDDAELDISEEVDLENLINDATYAAKLLEDRESSEERDTKQVSKDDDDKNNENDGPGNDDDGPGNDDDGPGNDDDRPGNDDDGPGNDNDGPRYDKDAPNTDNEDGTDTDNYNQHTDRPSNPYLSGFHRGIGG